MKAIKWILWLTLSGAAASGTAWADGRGHGHHRGPRVGVGVYFGVPFGYPWYALPPYYYPPGPPVVVVRPEPQVYIERSAPQSTLQSQPVWYYCGNPHGYYPYVKECPGGWQHVVPTPPPN